MAGFDDQDMERPSFTQPARHPLLPLLLSKPGVEPAVQVSSKPVHCMSTVHQSSLLSQTFSAKWIQQSFVTP